MDAPVEQAKPSKLNAESTSSVVRFHVVPFEKLSDSAVADWLEIRGSHSQYRSPFFSHDFIRTVAGLLPGVEVALAERNGRTIALLPFRRVGSFHARPVGAGINDAHGLLADTSVDFQFEEMLKACGLKSFAFHAAPPKSPGVSKYEIGRTNAFLADLTVDPLGYEHFLRSRNKTIDKQGQKTRKLGREVGELRFEYDCRDSDMIRRLLNLKSEQYQRTHTFDILSVPWIQELLYKFHGDVESENRGILSVLHAGDIPVALHYGMIEGDLLHYWFPVYDSQYHFGSPGTQLFLDVAKEAAARGVTAIDMGYGEQPYKHKLTNVVTEMSYGLVDRNPVRRALFRGNLAVGAKLKDLKIRERIKPIARKVMPSFGKGNYVG